MSDGDYVLGTRDDEVARLGLQHRVWRDQMLAGLRTAGFAAGQTMLDVGAGPGFATADLAAIAGPDGKVIALERSPHFLAELNARNLANVEVRAQDVCETGFGEGIADRSWCRWLLAFVADPARTVGHIARALRPGGVAVFHEYLAYETWRLLPPDPDHERFRALIIDSWRASGGEPDIGQRLPALLAGAGLELVAARPMVEVIMADDPMWQWPASFMETGAARLHELGAATADEAQRFATCLDRLPAGTRMMTPLVGEFIARKR